MLRNTRINNISFKKMNYKLKTNPFKITKRKVKKDKKPILGIEIEI